LGSFAAIKSPKQSLFLSIRGKGFTKWIDFS
jgi:hypothetical protein